MPPDDAGRPCDSLGGSAVAEGGSSPSSAGFFAFGSVVNGGAAPTTHAPAAHAEAGSTAAAAATISVDSSEERQEPILPVVGPDLGLSSTRERSWG